MNATTKLIAKLITWAAAAASQGAVFAAEGEGEAKPLTFELGTGLEYDSNVAVLELDARLERGDTRGPSRLRRRLRPPVDRALRLCRPATTSRSPCTTTSTSSTCASTAARQPGYDLGRVDIGANCNTHTPSSTAGFLDAGATVAVRLDSSSASACSCASRTRTPTKSSRMTPARDATSDSLSADAYVFIDGLRPISCSATASTTRTPSTPSSTTRAHA